MTVVKFRKEKIENVKYEGDTQVRWWFDAGTKYLPAVYAVKDGYNWEVYDAEGTRYTRFLGYYGSLQTKADAKKFIEEYDAGEDARIANEKVKADARLAEFNAMKERENAHMEAFLKPAKAVDVKAGDMIAVYLDNASKAGHIGETLGNILVNGRYEEVQCKVVKVLNVDLVEYEAFCRNTLDIDSNFDYLMNDDEAGSVGGTASDHPDLANITAVDLGQPDNMQLYRQTMYGLVHAVVCPGRRNVYIDTQGYQYARYLGTDAGMDLDQDNHQLAA